MNLDFNVLEDDELDAFDLVVYGIPRNTLIIFQNMTI